MVLLISRERQRSCDVPISCHAAAFGGKKKIKIFTFLILFFFFLVCQSPLYSKTDCLYTCVSHVNMDMDGSLITSMWLPVTETPFIGKLKFQKYTLQAQQLNTSSGFKPDIIKGFYSNFQKEVGVRGKVEHTKTWVETAKTGSFG